MFHGYALVCNTQEVSFIQQGRQRNVYAGVLRQCCLVFWPPNSGVIIESSSCHMPQNQIFNKWKNDPMEDILFGFKQFFHIVKKYLLRLRESSSSFLQKIFTIVSVWKPLPYYGISVTLNAKNVNDNKAVLLHKRQKEKQLIDRIGAYSFTFQSDMQK